MMSIRLIHSGMIAADTLHEGLLTPELRAWLQGLDTRTETILATMSTDEERVSMFKQMADAFQAADQTLQGTLTTLIETAGSKVDAEIARAQAAEAALATSINTLTTQVNSVISAYEAAVTAEGDRSKAAEAELQAQIDALSATTAQLQSDLAALNTRVETIEASLGLGPIKS